MNTEPLHSPPDLFLGARPTHRIPCEYLDGHVWVPASGEDMLGNKITLEICAGCGEVKR